VEADAEVGVDIWGLLALFFAGAFFAILVLALFYWRAVRPHLTDLARASRPADSPANDRLLEAITALNHALVRHSTLISRLPTSFEIQTPQPENGQNAEALVAIRSAQNQQIALVQRLGQVVTDLNESVRPQNRQLASQHTTLQDVHTQLDALTQANQHVNTTLQVHSATLARLEERLQTHAQLADEVGEVRMLLVALDQANGHALSLLEDQSARLTTLDQRVNESLTQVGQIEGRLGRVIERRKTQLELQAIKGIGQVYSRRLYENGVQTFDDLAALSPADLLKIIDAPDWRQINAEGWIAQAQALASQRQQQGPPT
jgi:chromosome segregation ATPase